MANKPTSMAAMVAKQAADSQRQDDKADEKLARKAPPRGKVWVRLVRPFYDADGVYHPAGPTLLDKGAVPSSAKVLTASEVEAEEGDDGDDE